MRWLSLARNFFFLIWPLILSTEALGHGAESMARPNFETVGLGVMINEDCPLDKIAAREAADAEFLRARIKISELALLSTGGFWLAVKCIDQGNPGSYIFKVRVEWTWKQGGQWPHRTLAESFGETVDGAVELKKIIGNAVELGLTAYLKANLE